MRDASDNQILSLVPFDKEEWPPLLNPGFYNTTLAEVRAQCVDRFPLSKTRADIMHGIEELTVEFVRLGIHADFWLDGSFLTHKVNPQDIDMVIFVPSDVINNATFEQSFLLNWINNFQSLSPGPNAICHAFVVARWQAGAHMFEGGEGNRRYWIDQFGFSRSREIKGMMVVTTY